MRVLTWESWNREKGLWRATDDKVRVLLVGDSSTCTQRPSAWVKQRDTVPERSAFLSSCYGPIFHTASVRWPHTDNIVKTLEIKIFHNGIPFNVIDVKYLGWVFLRRRIFISFAECGLGKMRACSVRWNYSLCEISPENIHFDVFNSYKLN